MNSLAHSSDWVGKEIEVKPHKFDGDERSLESLGAGAPTGAADKASHPPSWKAPGALLLGKE